MPTTLTLKNVPDAVYASLRAAAQTHRRSINNEAIVCLEAVLAPPRSRVAEQLSRARALREALGGDFEPADISQFRQEGRA